LFLSAGVEGQETFFLSSSTFGKVSKATLLNDAESYIYKFLPLINKRYCHWKKVKLFESQETTV